MNTDARASDFDRSRKGHVYLPRSRLCIEPDRARDGHLDEAGVDECKLFNNGTALSASSRLY